MSRRELETFDEWPVPARRTKYPWKRLTSGAKVVLRQGRDFHVSAESMRSTIASYAKRHDLAVRMLLPPDDERPELPATTVFVRFYPERSYAQGPPEID